MKLIKKLYKKYEELVNYGIAGVLTTIVCMGSYYLLTISVLDANKPIELQAANIISWLLAVIFAYYINRGFVFKSKNAKKKEESIKFYASRLFTLLLDMGFMAITVTQFRLNDKIMKILSNVIVVTVNYILGKFLVFKKKPELEENNA